MAKDGYNKKAAPVNNPDGSINYELEWENRGKLIESYKKDKEKDKAYIAELEKEKKELQRKLDEVDSKYEVIVTEKDGKYKELEEKALKLKDKAEEFKEKNDALEDENKALKEKAKEDAEAHKAEVDGLKTLYLEGANMNVLMGSIESVINKKMIQFKKETMEDVRKEISGTADQIAKEQVAIYDQGLIYLLNGLINNEKGANTIDK